MKRISAVFLCLFAVLSALPGFSAETITIGIFPRRSAEATLEMFTPLAKKLEAELQVPVQLMYNKNPETFWQSIEKKRFDLVHISHYELLAAHRKSGYQIIAQNVENNKDTVSSILYVRADSNFQSVKDLQGKKILFSLGKKSFITYIAPVSLLMDAGLQPGDYEEAFAPNPVVAMKALHNGQVAAATGADITLEMSEVKQMINVDEIQKLVEIGPFPHVAWAVSENMNKEIQERISRVLLTLHESEDGRAVLNAAAIDRITKAKSSDYDRVREVIQKVTGEAL